MTEPSIELPCLILDMEEAIHWPKASWCSARQIPLNRRPTMLQIDREKAEAEALRLAREHPGRRFVVFQPVCAGVTAKVPTHVNINGATLVEREVAALVTIDDPNEVPF